MISWACFVGSELKLIFFCRALLFILERSIFSRLAESVLLWTTENSDASSANSFAFEFKQLTLGERPLWHLAMTNVDRLTQLYCFLLLNKSFIKVISSPDIPFCCNLKSKPSCQTLSNALDISRKTPLTSWPSSNAKRILCAIDSNWLLK